MNSRFRSRRIILVYGGLALAFVTGCRTPDLRPFQDSTARIHDGVVEAQGLYSAELERLAPFVPDSSELAKQGKRFSTNWQARVAVLDGMVEYAGSLVAVAGAPGKARAGLDNVAQSLKELSVAAGPYQAAVEGGTDIALELVDLANRVRAARQIQKAVRLTDPDVQRVAHLLVLDFSKLRFALEQNQRSIKNLMDAPLSRRLDARQAVENKMIERNGVLQEKLGGPDWETAVAQFNRETEEARKYLADANNWYVPHQAEVQAAQRQIADHIRFLRDTESAIVQWGRAHKALAQAFETGLAPDWTLLKQSAARIERSVEKIRNQPSTP